ncbi:MAG: CPXCG motif-containing cysteine-rich protein [Candidatus Korobacteraceae bacterium]
MTSGFQCTSYGEWSETAVDLSAGTKQMYIENCQVCWKPNVLRVRWEKSAGEYNLTLEKSLRIAKFSPLTSPEIFSIRTFSWSFQLVLDKPRNL